MSEGPAQHGQEGAGQSRSFRCVRWLSSLMLRSQYRLIEVDGAGHVPAQGAVLFVANHFWSIVDSMALLHASPRPATFLAKAPLWKSKPMAICLDAVGAVPVFRPSDLKENQGRGARANLATFEAVWERLRRGGSISIFPEGVSQSRPRLMPLRTGAARLAIGAEVPVSVCPAGLVFDRPAENRRGTLLVRFGAPFLVNGTEGYSSRRAAISEITRRMEDSLRAVLAEAESQTELRALQTARVVWEQERGDPSPRSLADAHDRNRRFAAGLARIREAAPKALEQLRADTDAYLRALDVVGIEPETLRGHYRLGQLWGRLALSVPLLLLAWPFSLLAAVITWPIRHIGDVIALRSVGGGEDVRPLARMVGGGLLLALLMAIGGVAAGLLFGPLAALGFVLLLPALLAFHIVWRDHSHAIRARIRSIALLSGQQLRRDLRGLRGAVYTQLLAVEEHLAKAPLPDSTEIPA